MRNQRKERVIILEPEEWPYEREKATATERGGSLLSALRAKLVEKKNSSFWTRNKFRIWLIFRDCYELQIKKE